MRSMISMSCQKLRTSPVMRCSSVRATLRDMPLEIRFSFAKRSAASPPVLASAFFSGMMRSAILAKGLMMKRPVPEMIRLSVTWK